MRALIFLVGLLPVALLADNTTPITKAQADSVIAAEMAAKKAERDAKKIDFTVLQRRTYDLGDHTMTLERAAPPNLPERETKPQPTPPTPAEQQAFQEMQQAELIPLRAVVYDNYGTPITHLRWQYDGKTYEAWSEADFNLFRTMHDFSLNRQEYRVSMFIFNESVEEMDKRRQAARAEGIELNLPEIPPLPVTDERLTEYFVESDDPNVFADEDAFIPLDDAHQFYDANLEELKTKLGNQEKLNAARQRYREANPATKDTTLTYWIEEK